MKARPIKQVRVTSDFEKAFQNLPLKIQKMAEKKSQLFRANAFGARLKTHKLKGKIKDHWSFSVNQKYRILFRFILDDEVLYYTIGTHAVYR